MSKTVTPPRPTPDRDSKYMGLAWIYAAFSKDPSTQVGACIVGEGNRPLGAGYNGPPRDFNDATVNWDRPSPESPDEFCKYDIMIHAEANAIDHSACNGVLEGATLYVTALPCPACMREIVRKKIARVVYMDYQSSQSSSLQNAAWRDKTFRLARDARVSLVKFGGNINWLGDWVKKLTDLGVFEMS